MSLKHFPILFVFVLSSQLLAADVTQSPSLTQTNAVTGAGFATIKNNIYKETLDNGLTLLFYHKPYTPEVMLQVLYDVGSKDEESQEYGFAHLVEHMIFKGTNKYSEQDIFEIGRKFGAEFNAMTNYDETMYYFYTDNKNWKVFLDILADCMENVRITDEHLASELKTIFNELKMRDADSSGNWLTELFPSNHPYHHPVIGYKENLLNLDAEKVRAFYKKYYQPDRATVLVVGDLDKEEVIREVKAAFGAIPCPTKTAQFKNNVLMHHTNKDFFQKDMVVYKSQQNTTTSCVWTMPGNSDIKSALCSIIISKYLSYKLLDILHDEKALVASVNAGGLALLKDGFFAVSFEPKKQSGFFSSSTIAQTTELCKEIITKEIEKIRTKGIPEDEFIRIRRIAQVGILDAFEDCSSIAGVLGQTFLLNKNEYEIFDELTLLDVITNADIKAFAQHYLRPALMNQFTIKPLQEKEKDEWLSLQNKIDEYDNSLLALKTRTASLEKPIAAQTLPDPKLLDTLFIKPDAEFDLNNGLHVILKHKDDTSFISSKLSFKNTDVLCRLYDLQGKGSVPHWAIGFLGEGTTRYSKQELREFFERLGASCGGSTASCLAHDFDVVAEKCIHILTKPAYPQKIFDTNQATMLKYMLQNTDNESSVAYDHLTKHIMQDDLLSKKTLTEKINDIKKSKRYDLVDFHEKHIAPQNMILVVVGNYNPATIKQQLERSFGRWKGSASARDITKLKGTFPVLQNPKAIAEKVYLPKERALIVAGRITAKYDDEDYFKLFFLERCVNKALFEIREQYGLFYGCSCTLTSGASDKVAGMASLSTELSLANVDAVTNLIKTTFNNIATNGVTAADFKNVRNTFINDYAKSNKTNFSIASTLGSIKEHDRPWDHNEKRFKKYLDVSLDDINAIAKKYLNPTEWSFVTVGRVEQEAAVK